MAAKKKIDTTNCMCCYFCGAPLRWEVNFSFRDYGAEETEGVVGNYTCDGCGASYEIWKPFEKDMVNNGS